MTQLQTEPSADFPKKNTSDETEKSRLSGVSATDEECTSARFSTSPQTQRDMTGEGRGKKLGKVVG